MTKENSDEVLRTIIDEKDLKRTIRRLAHEIIEKNKGVENLVAIGIRTRGAYLAERIIAEISKIEGVELPLGMLDITMYRDDFRHRLTQPEIQQTEIPFDIDEKSIILIDDVLYTGRTTRAALEAIMAFGRPKDIQLAVLVDRGGRELPIKPDYIGLKIAISFGEQIKLKMKEIDGEDILLLLNRT
ncbi:MAG: bifunctional pyr operon transcriptional regulator/uracil phosphoribosyltransferase PyrR [candidate division KSB1 bacterium]|jgi:pyrimidine operon attenuation protein/uracil phosphoribosyltransferase|nr:bifunctional pyr operon transcriptional regulator/uracil phosphoribosyltransferase PyrR [candidate division KSB1 bacterium]